MIEWLNEQFRPLLTRAEELYGPTDERVWKYIGIRFSNNGPNIWFPDHADDEVAITLSESARNDPLRALYQFAHEIIHLLHVDRSKSTTLLEEGVAVHFSIYEPNYRPEVYREMARQYILTDPVAANYRDALLAYERLRELDQDAVKKIRAVQSNLTDLTPDVIMRVVPTVNDDLANLLCERRAMR